MLSSISYFFLFFFFSSRRRHTRCLSDWSSDVCSSDLKNVAKQQDNPYHFACFHTSGNDALGQIPRVRLECLESSGFQRLHVVVIDGSRFGKDFFLAHRCQQLCLSDALGPFFSQLGAALSEVFNQLAE